MKETENNNFINEIRALTKENEYLSFSQKYPILATTIKNTAMQGYNSCLISLWKEEKEALEKEGFTVELYSVHGFEVSW